MRKTKEVVIGPDGGRDAGKKFCITELSARASENWANKAFLALAHSSISFPEGIEQSGMAGIAQIARLIGGMQFPEIAPLMDELLGCVKFVPDPTKSFVRDILDNGDEGDDIEEVSTRQLLRRECLDLHVSFFLGATVLNLMAAALEMRTFPTIEITRTSRRRSGRSSRGA